MQDDISELKQDVKDIKDSVYEIKSDVKANSVSLDAHMYRTELNERRIQSLEYWLLGLMGSGVVGFLVKSLLQK